MGWLMAKRATSVGFVPSHIRPKPHDMSAKRAESGRELARESSSERPSGARALARSLFMVLSFALSRALVFGVLLAYASGKGEACEKADPRCPVCGSANATIVDAGQCMPLPNPLVISADGMCCPSSACQPWQCASECDADAGASFARILGDDHESGPLESFDCSRSSSARRCAESFDASHNEECDCILHDCVSAASLFIDQPGQCVLECQNPANAATICSNYDDQEIWCQFYAVVQCMSVSSTCDSTKMRTRVDPTPCATTCMDKNQASHDSSDQQLDIFLQCLGTCTSSRQDREALAVKLEQ